LAVTVLAACSTGQVPSGSAAGDPIVIGGSGPDTGQAFNTPEQRQGLETAVAAINASGGINGRPLQLEFCDGRYDPNGEISCARQLVAKKVVAAINPNFTADGSGTAFKILDDARIPQIGNPGQTPASLTSPMSYLLSGGLPGWYYGAAAALRQAGATKVAILVAPSPTAQRAGQLMARALDAANTPTRTVVFDPKADPTGEITAAKVTADGVDGIGLALPPSSSPVVLSAINRGGFTGKVASANGIITPAVVQALGPQAEGMLVVSQVALTTDTANPGVARYLADLKQFDNGAQPKDLSLFAYASVMLFAQVVKGIDTIDPASVAKAFDSVSTPVDIGLVSPWATSGRTSPVAEWPRLLNPTVQVGVVHNGVVVPDGRGFVDPFADNAAAR
jgi:ABC-type branched-subunit amino acid transport system substrate-binding protein